MYKIKDESIKDLEDAFELLNQIETKGIQNHITITNIASLLQKFRGSMEEIEENMEQVEENIEKVENRAKDENRVKVSNLPVKKEKEKE